MTNPTSPMLEKMARAISPLDWEIIDSYGAEQAKKIGVDAERTLSKAKVALQSLKDLDEGTVEAMRDDGRQFILPVACRDAFTAAINHILRSGEG